MRKLLLSISLILITTNLFGQLFCFSGPSWDSISFDSTLLNNNFLYKIDTISNPNNIWQVGTPQKQTINSAYSAPNAIITDTLNHYLTNDTSIFMIVELDEGGFTYKHTAEIYGFYFVNSDSLKDYGTIEISLDLGTTWIDLITDTIYSSYYHWNTPKPTLTGNSNGWQNFWVSAQDLGNLFPVNYGDTILWKFTFISDSVTDTLDGLAFDGFEFCNFVEGIEEIQKDNLISIFPNPTNSLLFIDRKKQPEKEALYLYNYSGQLLFEDNNFISKSVDIGKLHLTDGLYFLKYSDTKNYAIKRFIVRH